MDEKPTLGQAYVTGSAALQYGRHTGQQLEDARRDLTMLLMRAHRTGTTDTGAERWRIRDRVEAVDVSATVVRQDGLAVVTAVSVREYRPRTTAERRRRKR